MYCLERGDIVLETIKDFFLSLADVITSLVDFVIGMITDLVYVVKLCGSFVLKIPTLFSWLPTPAVAIIVSIFAVVVIYKILGREG